MLCPPILITVASGRIRKFAAASTAAISCGSVSERCTRSVSSSAVVFAIRDFLSFFQALGTARESQPLLTGRLLEACVPRRRLLFMIRDFQESTRISAQIAYRRDENRHLRVPDS